MSRTIKRMSTDQISSGSAFAGVDQINVFSAAQIWSEGTWSDSGTGLLTINADGNHYRVTPTSDDITSIFLNTTPPNEFASGTPIDGHRITIEIVDVSGLLSPTLGGSVGNVRSSTATNGSVALYNKQLIVLVWSSTIGVWKMISQENVSRYRSSYLDFPSQISDFATYGNGYDTLPFMNFGPSSSSYEGETQFEGLYLADTDPFGSYYGSISTNSRWRYTYGTWEVYY